MPSLLRASSTVGPAYVLKTGETVTETSVAAPQTDSSDGNVAFKVEQRGIELIPEDARSMRPAGLFWLWAGAVWNVEFLVYGALIMSFGLSFGQAALAIVIGNLFYALLGMASLQGPATGTTAFMVSRAPFGQNGNRSSRSSTGSRRSASRSRASSSSSSSSRQCSCAAA